MARLLLVLLFVVGCQAGGSRPAARCDVAGEWSADLMAYDGKAHITVLDREALELELIGKATQHRKGRRLDERHLAFDFPSNPVRCEISVDCKRIACNRPDGSLEFKLDR